MLTPTAHWSPWIHTPQELGSQSQAQDSTCTELHSCRLCPLSDPHCYPGESPQPVTVSTNTPSTTHNRVEAKATGRAGTQEGSPILAWAGFSEVATARQPPACPSGAFSAAGLTTVLGHHPVTVRATRRPLRHPQSAPPLYRVQHRLRRLKPWPRRLSSTCSCQTSAIGHQQVLLPVSLS